jgi:hypothetical protein
MVFGSARTPSKHPDYELAREVGRCLGRAGYAVITGGGPGIMEAANRGAREVGALSIDQVSAVEEVCPIVDAARERQRSYARGRHRRRSPPEPTGTGG